MSAEFAARELCDIGRVIYNSLSFFPYVHANTGVPMALGTRSSAYHSIHGRLSPSWFFFFFFPSPVSPPLRSVEELLNKVEGLATVLVDVLLVRVGVVAVAAVPVEGLSVTVRYATCLQPGGKAKGIDRLTGPSSRSTTG